MDLVDYVRSQIAYNEWANGKLLDGAAAAGDEELRRERSSAYGSLANDLTHIVNTQRGWLSVLLGEPRLERPRPPEAGIVRALRDWDDESHRNLRAYADALTAGQLDGEVSARDESGKEYRRPAWQVVQHLMTHGIQHRGEVGIGLHQIGHSPGDVDFMDYLDSL